MPTNDDIHILEADWERDRDGLIAVRTRVFVEEQQVPPELEIDGMDPQCRHVKAVDGQGQIIGTGRLLPDAHVGRMCVLPEYRGRGIGGRLLQHFIDLAQHERLPELVLHAQVSALPFYQRYGFEVISEVFMEAGIEHQTMRLVLNQ